MKLKLETLRKHIELVIKSYEKLIVMVELVNQPIEISDCLLILISVETMCMSFKYALALLNFYIMINCSKLN